jgi:hypothetical protein
MIPVILLPQFFPGSTGLLNLEDQGKTPAPLFMFFRGNAHDIGNLLHLLQSVRKISPLSAKPVCILTLL